MPIIPNTYYQNPGVGQVVSNLGLAIFGDPEARAKRDLYGAQTQNYQAQAERNQADARKLGSEADIAGGRYSAQQAMTPEAMASLAPLPGESPIAHAIRTAPLLSAFAQYGTGAKDAADATGSVLSNLFSMGNPDAQRQSLVMQGKMPGKDFAGSRQESDQIAARDAAQDRQTKFGVANIDQSGANARNAATIAGQNTRFFNTPINAAAGNTIYIAPTDPRFGKVGGADGIVRGVPTVNTVRGEAGQRIYEGDKSPSLPGLFNGSGGVPKPGSVKPRVVTGKALDDAVGAAAAMVGAATRGTNNKVSIDPAFESSFDPGKVAAARQAAGAELAASGNVQRAGEIYLNALGVAPGSTFEKPGTLSSIFTGAKPGVVPPAAAVSAPAQPAIPPPASRPVGTKARGIDGVERIWNGQGWVAPGRGT